MRTPATQPQEIASLTPARTRQLLERVAAIYHQAYGESEVARAGLSRYGITDAALLDRHLVGYCDGRLRQILPAQGAVWRELEALGVLVRDGQIPGKVPGESVERFAGRVVFPVLDADGAVQNLYALADQPEMQGTLCLPGLPQLPWNIQAARLHADLLAVSAIIDGLALEICGTRNVIAVPCGLDSAAMKEVTEHGVRRVVAIDGGDGTLTRIVQELAGTQRSTRCSWRAITLPDRMSPVKYLGQHGAERLATTVAGALSAAAEELPKPTPRSKPERSRTCEGKPAQGGDNCHDGEAGLTLRFGPRLYRIVGGSQN